MCLSKKSWRFTGRLAIGAGFLWLAACATPPPVQEMSNARQALQAAEIADAVHLAPRDFQRARQLLHRASDFLARGEYEQARSFAVEARMVAWRAHEMAVSHARGGR